MAELDKHDVTELFMKLVPEDSEEWKDGSSFATYSQGFLVIWDSKSNPIVLDANAEERRTLAKELRAKDAECWPWDQFAIVCDYPEWKADEETYNYLERMTNE